MSEQLHPSQTMYCVEKFLPTECPKCRQPFRQDGPDYTRLLGDIIDGRKVVRETNGYDIIICNRCENSTARVLLESWQVGDRERAAKLLQKGFVNLQQVTAFGTATRDAYQLYVQLPGIKVRGVSSK